MISAGPDLTTDSRWANFVFAADGVDATGLLYECALDEGEFSPCLPPKAYNGLPLGEHIFRVRAVILDPNGLVANVDPTPARHYFTIVEAPETFIDIGPEAEVNGSTANFVFSSSVQGATFECALDFGQ